MTTAAERQKISRQVDLDPWALQGCVEKVIAYLRAAAEGRLGARLEMSAVEDYGHSSVEAHLVWDDVETNEEMEERAARPERARQQKLKQLAKLQRELGLTD